MQIPYPLCGMIAPLLRNINVICPLNTLLDILSYTPLLCELEWENLLITTTITTAKKKPTVVNDAPIDTPIMVLKHLTKMRVFGSYDDFVILATRHLMDQHMNSPLVYLHFSQDAENPPAVSSLTSSTPLFSLPLILKSSLHQFSYFLSRIPSLECLKKIGSLPLLTPNTRSMPALLSSKLVDNVTSCLYTMPLLRLSVFNGEDTCMSLMDLWQAPNITHLNLCDERFSSKWLVSLSSHDDNDSYSNTGDKNVVIARLNAAYNLMVQLCGSSTSYTHLRWLNLRRSTPMDTSELADWQSTDTLQLLKKCYVNHKAQIASSLSKYLYLGSGKSPSAVVASIDTRHFSLPSLESLTLVDIALEIVYFIMLAATNSRNTKSLLKSICIRHLVKSKGEEKEEAKEAKEEESIWDELLLPLIMQSDARNSITTIGVIPSYENLVTIMHHLPYVSSINIARQTLGNVERIVDHFGYRIPGGQLTMISDDTLNLQWPLLYSGLRTKPPSDAYLP